MKYNDTTTQKWFIFYHRYPPEPKGMLILSRLSSILAISLFIFAGVVYSSETDLIEFSCAKKICPGQKIKNEKMMSLFERYQNRAKDRLDNYFNSTNIELFEKQWSLVEREAVGLFAITKRKNPYDPHEQNNLILKEFFFFLLSIILPVFMARLIIKHVLYLCKYYPEFNIKELENWKIPFIFISILISFPMIMADIVSSIFAESKLYYFWSSFCISQSSFFLILLAYLFFGCVIASPLTLMWCFTSEKFFPDLEGNAPDRYFGGKRYIEFLQTWTLWFIFAPSTLGILWLSFLKIEEIDTARIRIFVVSGIALSIAIIVGKCIYNAIRVRLKCRDILEDMRQKSSNSKQPAWRRKSPEREYIPMDPTIDFLGEKWWKLPTSITLSLVAIWALINFFRMDKLIKSIFSFH